MNIKTGQIKWDDLTPEERSSGEWIKLPATDENGYVVGARLRGPAFLDSLPRATSDVYKK